MENKNTQAPTHACKKSNPTSEMKDQDRTANPYCPPKMEISYVALESGIAACSVAVNNSPGEVKEDWGDENYYDNDINF